MNRIKIGINGFGRIGRAFLRINLKYNAYDIVAINEIDPDIHNMAYLLKYDTTYGKLQNDKIDVNEDYLIVNGNRINIFCKDKIQNVCWSDFKVDVIIDSSGVFQNVIDSRLILSESVKKVITTHSPKEGVDFTFIYGVNEQLYDKNKYHVISSSICDVNAVAPFVKVIDDTFGIEMGEITTLHPWLSYQNLLDGNLKSVSSPGHYWKDYALGRSSIGSLIPKDTTLVSTLEKVLPHISKHIHAASFRTPTSIVTAADGVVVLKRSSTIEHIIKAINDYCAMYPDVLIIDNRSLVSIDYLANENAAVIDARRLFLNKGSMLKFLLWYDNEWGYTKRVYNLISYLL